MSARVLDIGGRVWAEAMARGGIGAASTVAPRAQAAARSSACQPQAWGPSALLGGNRRAPGTSGPAGTLEPDVQHGASEPTWGDPALGSLSGRLREEHTLLARRSQKPAPRAPSTAHKCPLTFIFQAMPYTGLKARRPDPAAAPSLSDVRGRRRVRSEGTARPTRACCVRPEASGERP